MFCLKPRNLRVFYRSYRCYQSIFRPVILSKFSTHSPNFFNDKEKFLEEGIPHHFDVDDMDNDISDYKPISIDSLGEIDNLMDEMNFLDKKMENITVNGPLMTEKIEKEKEEEKEEEEEDLEFDRVKEVDLSHNKILSDFEALQIMQLNDKSREKELSYSLVVKPLLMNRDSFRLIEIARKYRQENNINMARLYYKYIVNSSPFKPQSFQAWGNFEYNLGRYNEARRVFAYGVSTLLSIESSRKVVKAVYVLLTWAGMERKLRQYDKARELYMNCITMLPEDSGIWIKWSDMELLLGNIDRFRKIMESYLYKYSKDSYDWIEYSKSLQKYSLHGTALSILQEAYNRYPDDANVIIALAELYEKTNQKEKSEDLYKKSVINNPDNFEVLFKIASSAERNGQIEKARNCYQKIINQNYNNAEAWSRLGTLEYQQHNDKHAKICFQTANRIDPDDVNHIVNLALAEFREGSNETAEELLNKTKRFRTNSSTKMAISCLRGRILAKQLKYEEAEEVFRKLIDESITNINAYYHYAEDVLIPQKKWKEAIDQLTQCRDLIRDPSKYDFINSRINECMKQLKGSSSSINQQEINNKNSRQRKQYAQANLDLSSILNQKTFVNNKNNNNNK